MSRTPGISSLWSGTAALLQGRWAQLFAIAAPFTLLVDMSLRLFGPAQPATAADVSASALFWLVLLPTIIGSIGQLAVVHVLLRPEMSLRSALPAAFAAWPGYLAAFALSLVPSALAGLLLVLPGIYVTSRLLLLMPLAITNPRGSPVSFIRTSWQLTSPVGWTLFGFILLAVLGVIGLSLIAGGVGAAVGSVLTLLGLDSVGRFAAGLLPAIASTLVAIATAGFTTRLYLTVRPS